jgi:HPt (histidine-containing phosphotransfer) domain-containing protein
MRNFQKTKSGIIVSQEAKLRYLRRCEKDLLACKEAILGRDYKLVEKVGHQLRGNASTFGFDELGVLGEELEHQAETKDIDQLTLLIQKLSNKIEVFINS